MHLYQSQHSFSSMFWLIFLFFFRGTFAAQNYVQCVSCFVTCTELDKCQGCNSRNDTCRGNYCFTRMDFFAEGEYFAVIMGCSNYAPVGESKCHRSGQDNAETVFCFCEDNFCNIKTDLSAANVATKAQNQISCCSIPRPNRFSRKISPEAENQCPLTCNGSFCYSDHYYLDQKGCGDGLPLFYNDLLPNAIDLKAEERICMEKSATREFHSNLCICTGKKCNEKLEKPNYSRRKFECFSCYQKQLGEDSDVPDMCSEKCHGNFCFITLTYGSLEQDYDVEAETFAAPFMSDQYELQSGCLNVEPENVVQFGCKIEWNFALRRPLAAHCVCNTANCNHLNMIDDEILNLEDPQRKLRTSTTSTTTTSTTSTTLAPQLETERRTMPTATTKTRTLQTSTATKLYAATEATKPAVEDRTFDKSLSTSVHASIVSTLIIFLAYLSIT